MSSNLRMCISEKRKPHTEYRAGRDITRRAAVLLTTVFTLVIAACGGDSATGPSTPDGTYNLTTVQGKPVPYRMFSETNYSLDVTSGSMVLKPDGTFLATMRVDERVDNHVSVYNDTATGKWALVGASIDLTASDGSHTTGARSGRTLTFTDSSATVPVVFVYTMQ